jgi:hypothetical protein
MAQAELEAAEAIIASECRALLEVGQALLSIRRSAGHRHLGFSRFEDYMHARWHLGRAGDADRGGGSPDDVVVAVAAM